MSARASLAYFLTRGLSGALAVATISLFARLLGPEGYASLTIAQTLVAFIGSLCLQPLHTSLGRFLPGSTDPGLTATLGRLLLAGCVAAFLLAGGLELWGPSKWPCGVALAAAVLCLGQGIFDFAAQWASARLLARRYSWLYFIKALLTPAIGVTLIYCGAGFFGAVLGMFASYVLATLFCAPEPWLAVAQGTASRNALHSLWPYAPGFALSSLLSVTLSWSDRLMIGTLAPQGLGAYGAGNDLTQQGFGLVFSALYLAWYPRLVAAWEGRDTNFPAHARRYTQLSIAVLLPVATGFALISRDLTHVLLGSAFQADAPRVMPWLAVAAALGGIRMYLTDIPLHLARRMWLQSLIVGISGLCAVGLNLWLLPRYGILGAAWSSIAANAVGLVLSVLAARRSGGLHWPWRDTLSAVACAAVMAGVLHLLPEGSLLRMLLRIVAGIAVFGLMAAACDLAGARTWLRDRWPQRHQGA